MKKILITLLKPLSFLPALLMMYIIFSFSAQTGEVSGNLSYKISYQIVETKNELLNTGKSYEELAYEAEQIHYYVRKAAAGIIINPRLMARFSSSEAAAGSISGLKFPIARHAEMIIPLVIIETFRGTF